jgi:hypothetical protein
METGYVKIIMEEGKTPSVEGELVNGNVWLSKWKIARLFNCFNQKIEMNLRSIFNRFPVSTVAITVDKLPHVACFVGDFLPVLYIRQTAFRPVAQQSPPADVQHKA